MAPYSGTLAWKILWTGKPGRLQSMGLLRVGYDWATSLSLFTFHFHALEKEMETHSSVLAWRVPGMGEPGGLLSVGSHRVKHDWSDLAAAAAVKAMVFPVVMYGCESLTEESWVPKNWCSQTVVLEKTLESPLDYKEIQPVHSKGNQSWVFFGRTDAKAETPILWPPLAKSWLIGKDPDAGRDWGQEEKGMKRRGWDGWMASPTRWTWVWVNSGSWWWTRRPGMLRFMGSQRVGHGWATELNCIACKQPKTNIHLWYMSNTM